MKSVLSGVLLTAFLLTSPSPARAIGWSDALKLVIGFGDVIHNLIEDINAGYTTEGHIGDDIRLRRLNSRLERMLRSMSANNSTKGFANLELDLYLKSVPVHPGSFPPPPWSEVQDGLAHSLKTVTLVLNEVQDGSADIIASSGLKNHAELVLALKRQQQFYKQIASVPEPKTASDFNYAKQVSHELHALYDQILNLEGAIDKHLGHPT